MNFTVATYSSRALIIRIIVETVMNGRGEKKKMSDCKRCWGGGGHDWLMLHMSLITFLLLLF